MELTYLHSQQSESTCWVVKFKEDIGQDERHRQWEEMPKRGGALPKERGRSTAKHQTTSSRWTPERLLAAGYSALAQWPGSLKQERMPVPQPTRSTPTQSPAQKNTKLKLKLVVQKSPPKQPDSHPTSGWQPDRALPYHSMAEKPEDFMHYIMQSGLMVHEHFITEIDDLMIFGHECSSIACQVVASTLYTELAWFKGYPYTFLAIPPQLERRAPDPIDALLPEHPQESRSCRAVGLKENCQVWWHYLLALLQYWKDAKSPYPYGGPLHHDSTLSMYIYYHIKCLLCMGRVELQHYSIKYQTPWTAFVQKNYTPNQITKQRETYAVIVDKLQELKVWLHKCYEAEADAEIHEAEQCGGDIQKMSQPRASEDLRPGNDTLYVGTDKKGTRPNIRPAGSEFDGGNSLVANGAKSPRVWRGRSTPWVRTKALPWTCVSPHPSLLINLRLPSWHPWRRRQFWCKNTMPGDNADK